jgi:hypothetical protein
MKRANLTRWSAVLGCVAALSASTAALAPTALAAPAGHGAKSCGSKTIAVQSRNGKVTRFPVSRIRVEGGATCAEAVRVIRGVVTKHLPPGWTASRGNFKVPHGLTAQQAVNGKKRVKFALPGPEG